VTTELTQIEDWQKKVMDERHDRYMATLADAKDYNKNQFDSVYEFHKQLHKIATDAVPRNEYDIYHQVLSARVSIIYVVVLVIFAIQFVIGAVLYWKLG
jgi:hypothetical protein